MSADVRGARRAPSPGTSAERATRHLRLVEGGDAPLPATPPHWGGAMAVVMALGAVVVGAALVAPFVPTLVSLLQHS